jgi:hypothetical protein
MRKRNNRSGGQNHDRLLLAERLGNHHTFQYFVDDFDTHELTGRTRYDDIGVDHRLAFFIEMNEVFRKGGEANDSEKKNE